MQGNCQSLGGLCAAEEGLLFRDIAEVIGRRLNVPVVRKATERGQPLRLVYSLCSAGGVRLESADSGTAGLAAEAARADCRYRAGKLFRDSSAAVVTVRRFVTRT